MTEWITGSELGRRVGMTSQGITAARHAGRIKRHKNGKYDAEASIKSLADTKSREAGPGRGGAKAGAEPKPPGKPKSLVYWKTREAKEGALKKRLERLEREGSLVRRDVAEAEAATLMATVRSRMDGLGRGLQDALAACSEPRKCGDMVDGAIRKVFEALADGAPEEEGEDGQS